MDSLIRNAGSGAIMHMTGTLSFHGRSRESTIPESWKRFRTRSSASTIALLRYLDRWFMTPVMVYMVRHDCRSSPAKK